MLNKNRLNRRNSFKYAIMLPFLAVLVLLFNIKTEAQTLTKTTSSSAESPKTGNNLPTTDKDFNPVTFDKELTGDFMDPSDVNVVSDTEKTIAPSQILQPNFYIADKTPLYLVDGKETSKSDLDIIDPKSIEAMTVWKGQQAIDMFGEKGKNGVVEIETKQE